MVELFWSIPILSHFRDSEAVPRVSQLSGTLDSKSSDSGTFSSFNMITTDGIFYWNNFQGQLLIQRTKVCFRLQSSSSDQVQEEILTIVPKHLERTRMTAIVGDKWMSRNIRLVFVNNDVSGRGRKTSEMKELNFTWQSFLNRFRIWRVREQ